jgi:hypothetical protein
MLLYFPQEMVFPASLENLTLFIAYCFQNKIASSDSSLNFWICKRERWSAAVFFIPGIWTALNKILKATDLIHGSLEKSSKEYLPFIRNVCFCTSHKKWSFQLLWKILLYLLTQEDSNALVKTNNIGNDAIIKDNSNLKNIVSC